jgi:hypothetical protein
MTRQQPPVDSRPGPPLTPDSTKPKGARRRWRKVLLIALPLLLLAAAWAGLILGAKHVNMADPVAVSTQFLNDVSAGRARGVYSLLTERYRQKVSYDDFTSSLTTPYAERLAGRQPIVYVSDYAADNDPNRQTVLFNFEGNGQPGQTSYCAMVTVAKDGKQWHVSAYEVSEGNYSKFNGDAGPDSDTSR